MNQRVEPRQRTQPARALRGKWSQPKAKHDTSEQSHEPFAKTKRRHGKPRPARAHRKNRGVIDVEKSRHGLVEDVQREGHRECEPGFSETSLNHSDSSAT